MEHRSIRACKYGNHSERLWVKITTDTGVTLYQFYDDMWPLLGVLPMAETTHPPLQSTRLSGDAHARGLTHGSAHAEAIAQNVETYLSVFAYHGAEESTVYEQADEFWPLIQQENPEYAEEMEGIAHGSNVPIEDITVLNARYEVMYSAFAAEAEGVSDESGVDACTAFGVQPEATVNDHTYLGQNWDWMPALNTFVMDIQRDDKPNMVTMTEAGIVGGKIGVNEHGIGILLNGLTTASDGENPFRLPYHVRFREALDATRLDQAIAPLITTKRANSANVVLGHAAGEIINLELTPENAHYLYPDDQNILVHANHFQGSAQADSTFEKLIPDTLCRAPRIRRLLQNERGSIDSEVAATILRDHFGRPSSICRHPDETKPDLERIATNGSFIIDLNERTMLGTGGPPCQYEYQQFRVAS